MDDDPAPSVLKTAAELDYSSPLDVHTWSDYEEVNEFIDLIHEQHFSDPLSKIAKKHLKVVLLDLYVAWTNDPELCTAVHLNERKYEARSRYNALHISKKTIEVVKTLHEIGLVHLVKGYIRRERRGKKQNQ